MATMRSVVIDGRERMSARDVPVPEAGVGEVLVRVDWVGVCGSDLHYYFEGANGEYAIREPLVPGHELSGRVERDPSGALAPGTPVTVHPARFGPPVDGLEEMPHLRPGGSYLGSASTWPHTQGALSELLVVDQTMIRALPGGLPIRRAVLAEPLGVALHAVSRAGDVAGADVLISGAGPIGLLALAAARARGAATVTVVDVLPEALDRAAALGADAVLGAGEAEADRFDVVLECSGAPVAITAACAAARRRGTIVQVGMVPNEPRPVNLAPLVSKEVALVGTFRFHDGIDEAIVLLRDRPELERVITHAVPLEDAVEAFGVARDGRLSGKVVIAVGGAA